MTRVVLGIALLSVAGCRAPLHPYPEEMMRTFVEQCTKRAPKGACECTLDELRRRFTYEQYTAMEAQIQQTGKPSAELEAAANACR